MVGLLYIGGCLIKVKSNLLESHGLAVIHRWLSYQGSEQPFGKPWFGRYTQVTVLSRLRGNFWKAMVWLLYMSNLLESHGLAVIHRWLSYQGSIRRSVIKKVDL